MNWVVCRILMLCPAWVAACTVYNQDLLGADGDGGSANVGGSGSNSGAGASGGSSAGGKGNSSGGTSAAGSSGATGGTDGSGGSDNAGGANAGSGGSGADSGSGGTSGGGADGGSGGSGPPKTYSFELLDDFEDGDAAGEVSGDRAPMWYLFDDKTASGVLLPEEIEGAAIPKEDAEARPGSNVGLFVSVSGFTDWGAGVGIDFVNPKAAYDASAYAGIRFYAKATSEYKTLRFNVSQVLTDSSQEQCTKCDDHFGKALTLTDEWKEYRLLFSDLKREGWGDAVDKLHLDELLGVMFLVKPNKSVDFWIDDISLMKEEPTPSEANIYP